MKCKNCQLLLFNKDCVDYDIKYGYCLTRQQRKCDSDGRQFETISETLRCPKCFALTKINYKRKLWDDPTI